MNKPPTEQLLEVWNKSYWLRNCDRAFATKAQKDEWGKLDNVSAMEQFKTAFETQKGTKTGFFDCFGSALETVQPVISARAKLTNDVNANVLHWLQDGQLVGLGYETPRKLDSAVRVLPTKIWHGQIDWSGSSVAFHSMHFIDIRVMHAKQFESFASSPETGTRMRGRPTIVHDLEACFKQLNLEGAFDTSGSMKSQFSKIRTWLNENCTTNDQGKFEVSDEAIRKKFSPFFKDLKTKPKA